MAECCPPGHGCDAPRGDEASALTLYGAETQEPDAALALARWEELRRGPALRALAMRIKPWILHLGFGADGAHDRRRTHRGRLARGATS